MDRLQAMGAFVAVVDEGGFASAARKLDLSPPVVTRAVAELEERLGLKLLTRTTRRVRVTDAGARYADECRRILALVDEADAAATGVHDTPRGQLALTAPVLFGQMYVMPIVVEYLRRYPEVDASCLFLDRIVNLLEEGVDVAIRIGELPDSSLRAIEVGHVRRVVVASPGYLAERGVPTKLEDLVDHIIVSASGVTPSPQWRFRRGSRQLVQPVTPRIRTTSNESAIVAALAGFGLARLLSYQVASHVASGALQVVLEDHETGPLPLNVVHHEGRRAPQKVRAFVDLAVETLRGDASLR